MDKIAGMNPTGRVPPGSSSLLTYEPYYGLREKPFSLSSDPRFLYTSPAHAETFEDLVMGIRRREGLIVLTGDIGTGKTMLCKAMLEKLDRKTFITYVPDPFVSREDLLRMLLLDFGVMSVDDLKSGRMSGASRPDLSYPLYEFLRSLVPLQAFAVLIIDEAQNLPVPLLEEIRILSDLQSPEKLLQVLLVGQLELQTKLKLPEMRQVDQRVSVRCSLQPLSRDGVSRYISHRLSVAGGADDRIHFSPNAADAVFRASGGIPRVVNLICDRSLQYGYTARKSVIDLETVSLAIAKLGVGELTAPPQMPAAAGVPAAAGQAAPGLVKHGPDTLRADDADFDVKDLQEGPRAPNHRPAKESAALPPMFSAATGQSRGQLGESASARGWRARAILVATTVGIGFGIVFLVLLGNALFVNYFPKLDQQSLMLPQPPRRSIAPLVVPVQVPEAMLFTPVPLVERDPLAVRSEAAP